MSELAFKMIPVEDQQKEERVLKARIEDTHSEELIIGLCGPIGTNIHFVAEQIKEIITEKYNYETFVIKLSDFIKNFRKIGAASSYFKTISGLIDAGNELREEKGNSVLAELAINEIDVTREQRKEGEDSFKSLRICYIIDSIKNNEELELFRMVYSGIFYFVGVFSNTEVRERNLESKGMSKSEVYELIDRDSGEEKHFGQKVSDTFVQADFFLRLEKTLSDAISYKITRFLNLIFSSEVVTPTYDETAMYQAYAASGNSACLSRQVGAAITSSKGEILSVGWNDVPKFGGGVYTTNDADLQGMKDHRCINVDGGVCFNDSEKEVIRGLLLNKLVEQGIVKESDRLKAEETIKKSRIKEIIEFSRAVHAEMHAIITGSQKAGSEIVGGKLYCTTYPCHNCARHIVVSGIKDVYYIEPYRKSLALKLHDDAISENENDENSKVRILMFDGVAPRRYLDLFKMVANSRKENGKKKKQNKQTLFPKNTITLQAIPLLEKEIIKELQIKELIKI